MKVTFKGMPADEARALQDGGSDANGRVPERAVSNGKGNPCRHCMDFIKEGEDMLIVAHRPFSTVQPYAEQGPVFLHAKKCDPYVGPADQLPPVLHDSDNYIVRGYDDDERIVYGTGKVTEQEEIVSRARDLLADGELTFLHVRSSSNNCWQARIERAERHEK